MALKFALALGAAMVLAAPSAIGLDPTTLGVGYICSAEDAAGPATPGVMLTGVGNGGLKADTTDREAQAWFDNALQLYHAFNHEEAKAAFAKAASLDPECAMCAWGVALSLGPTLNYQITPAQTAEALAAADKAAALLKPGDERAAGLVATLRLRYASAAPAGGREQAYGKALDQLVRRWPTDDGLIALTAHALLTPARQDDYAGVPRAEEILRQTLERKPNDTAAIHYYIHATEFAGHAGLALPYARKLAGLAPNAGHLVHMGTHTFMRVGNYEDVALANAESLQAEASTKTKLGEAGPLSNRRYYLHNYLFGLGGAMMAGDGRLALKYADHAGVAFPATAAPDRRITAHARSLVALGRFAPDRALALPAPTAETPRIEKIYRHYARGEAFAAKGDAAAVRIEADAIAALGAEAMKAAEVGNISVANVAAEVLRGRAAMVAGDPAAAAQAYAKAAAAQDSAFPVFKNFDPPPWWYPVRRSVAAAHLKAGRYPDAIREARLSLKDWPNDALALRVLAQAEAKSGDANAAAAHTAQARRDWRGDLAKAPLDLT